MQHLQFIKLYIVHCWINKVSSLNQTIRTSCHLWSQEPVNTVLPMASYMRKKNMDTNPPEVIVFKSFIDTDWLDDDCLDLNVRETESLLFCLCVYKWASITKSHMRGKGRINIYKPTTFPKNLHGLHWISQHPEDSLHPAHTPKHLFQWAALTQLFRGETCS